MCLMGNLELLCIQCGGMGPHLVVRGKTLGFSRVDPGTWSTFSSYGGDGHSKLLFLQRLHDSCLVTKDTSGISSRLVRTIRMLLEVRKKSAGPFAVAIVILGFLPIFNKNQSSSPFEALNFACLSMCQHDVSPPFQVRWGHRAFSRVSTGDSDIPSSFEMKEEPLFKPLQANGAFFRVRASRCPLQLRQQTQGPSHIPIAEGSLPLKCL